MPNSRSRSTETKSAIQLLYARALAAATVLSLMSPESSQAEGKSTAWSRPSASITSKRAWGS
jgi:hypothetical protein